MTARSKVVRFVPEADFQRLLAECFWPRRQLSIRLLLRPSVVSGQTSGGVPMFGRLKTLASDEGPAKRTIRRQRAREFRPGLFDRIELVWSTRRYMDGVWIGSWRRPADLSRIEEAMLLIKQHSPVHYSRILRDLARVWVSVLMHPGAQYRKSVRACVLDERYFDSSNLERLASTIVHEATHARLVDCGFKYEEHQRLRIEAVCRRRELAFAAMLPNGAELRREIQYAIGWYAANPEWYSNAQFQERTEQQIVDAIRHVDAPEWLIRIVPKVRSAVLRMRRLFRPAS